ncbi:MAG: hypothetical protein AB1720_12340 [Pseudomonadota bacterium]|jgi:mono/diheme cytochrome c family protein
MKTSMLLLAGFCAGLAFPVAGQDVARGKALFETHCSRCHHDSGASLKTPLAALPAFLASRSVRAHRFQLSEAELQDIVASLAVRTPPR